MQKLQQTIEEAVTGVVEVFISEDEKFSVYNITTSLRDLLNQGWIRITGLQDSKEPVDLEDNSSDKVDSQYLPHSLVKETFQKLLNEGKIKCSVYGRGMFTTYGPEMQVCVSPAPQQSQPAQSKPDQNTLEKKIEAYIQNRGAATLKQIQSRLKIKGVTCKDIEQIVSGLTGVACELADTISKQIAKIK